MARGDLTPAELMQAQSRRVKQKNPVINAFTELAPLAQAPIPCVDSALAGTSFAVKDNIDVAGMCTHAGLRALNPAPAEQDALVVKRLRDAGLQFSGRLNMAPMAIGASTRNPDFGDCYHPWQAGVSAGGSSGGSASAVAAGLVSLSLGTDTMGSVRLPAAYCGIVGFKPSWGRIPTEGVWPLSRWLDHVGILARSVEDAEAAYRVLAAPSALVGSTQKDHSSVLAMPGNLDSLGLDPSVRRSFTAAIQTLQASGLSLRSVDLTDYLFGPVRRAGLQLCEAELLARLGPVYPQKRDQFPPTLCEMLDYIDKRSAADLTGALNRLLAARQWLDNLLHDIDYLVLPTTPHLAPLMSEPDPINSADLTTLANVMGAPAISLPLPADAGGLSAGLQIIGHRHQDESLLAMAGLLARQL